MARPWIVQVRRRTIYYNPAVSTGPTGDMSLQKNEPNQNFTFGLINALTGSPLTGATITGFVSKDGGSQASIAGTITELGNGQYNYAITQAETNANCVSVFITGTASNGSAVPENLMFLTGGLHRNVGSQHITFAMVSTAGVADPSATVSVNAVQDNGSQAAGAGTVTNLGHGQYDYAPTAGETNGAAVSFLFSASSDVSQNLCIFTVT